MAYNKYMRFFFTGDSRGTMLEYDGVQLNELYMWGEFIVSPVLSAVNPRGTEIDFSPSGTVVIRMANDPRVYQSWFRPSNGDPLEDTSWSGFEVDGFRYHVDSVQIGTDGATIEVTGINGTAILPA